MFIRFILEDGRPYIARVEEIESYGTTTRGVSHYEVRCIRFRSGREIEVRHTLEELESLIGEYTFTIVGDGQTAPDRIIARIEEERARGRTDIWLGARLLP